MSDRNPPREAPTLDRVTQVQSRQTDQAQAAAMPSRPPSFPGERYEVGDLIGIGGMGEVRSCQDQHIGREVAMKVVLRAVDSAHSDARFLEEARVQARLEHPGIVPVYEVGRDAEDRAFFTMKRVHGVTLDVILDRLTMGDAAAQREYSRHRLLTAFATVCLTVEFAHARGVLHRDLKPSNVMFGDFGEIYVLDWGAARANTPATTPASIDVPADAAQPQFAEVVGTPGYMSPEQARGGPIDARADVFALGAILFEILALRLLFRDQQDAADFAKHPSTVKRSPAARAPELNVPAELDAVCLRATAPNPASRYATVRELHDAVERFLAGDRDLELRRKLASEHLVLAERKSERVLAGAEPPEARAEALREVGRAIALAPEDPRALRLLVRLLGEPAKTLPREVDDQLEAQRYARFRKTAPIIALAVPPLWLTIYPVFCLIAGVRDWAQTVVVPIAWCFAGAVTYLDVRWLRLYWKGAPWLTPAAMLLASAFTTLLSGPLMIVPIVVVALTMGFSLAARTGRRYTVAALGCAAILVPALLAWSGVHHVYEFRGDALVVTSALVTTPASMFVGQTIVNLLAVLLVSRFGVHYRSVFHEAEARGAFLTWQLSKLLPDRDRPSIAPAA